MEENHGRRRKTSYLHMEVAHLKKSVMILIIFFVSAVVLAGCVDPNKGTVYGYISIPSGTFRTVGVQPELILKSPDSIRGAVALRGAQVAVAGQPQVATTNSSGYFELSLDPGEYTLSVTHPNYVGITGIEVQVESGKRTDASTRLGTFHYIVIDIGDYVGEVNDLTPGPENDAQLLLETVGQNNRWARTVTHVENTAATKQGIIDAVNRVKAEADWQDYVVVYYSGHGYQTGDAGTGYYESIVSSDGQDITDDELESLFAGYLTRDIVFIFDSCFSGGMTKSLGDNRAFAAIARDLNQSGYVVLMASDKMETSMQVLVNEVDQGLFTYVLCEGVTTRAADWDDDGIITAAEAFDYAAPDVLDISTSLGTPQHPQIWPADYSTDVPLIRYE